MTDPKERKEERKRHLIQALLFVVTIITTTLAGAEFMTGRFFLFGSTRLGWDEFLAGFQYSFPFLLFLTVHEFGHYITARLYKIRVTLPYYIPFWFGYITSFGSMGAVIRIKGIIFSRKQFFDIGIAGPLAGFVVAIGILWYGFAYLPPPEYIFEIHPEYQQYGFDYANHVYQNTDGGISLGTNLLFEFFANFVASDPSHVPNPHEIIHYPWLLAGYLALFFTSLNLMPIGQLDGGHILYGIFGYEKHSIISRILFVAFVFYAGLGLITPDIIEVEYYWVWVPLYGMFLYNALFNVFGEVKDKVLLTVAVFAAQFLLSYIFPGITGYIGWLLFSLLIGRVLGVHHPQAIYEHPLDWKRKLLGWLAFIIFILCFSTEPFIV